MPRTLIHPLAVHPLDLSFGKPACSLPMYHRCYLMTMMTKALTSVSRIVWRIISNAMLDFAEMYVGKKNKRMWNRYRGLFNTVNVFAGICGVWADCLKRAGNLFGGTGNDRRFGF